jgi:hypothetical protein
MLSDMPDPKDAFYSEQDTIQRRDDAIRRALATPPKPNSSYVGKGKRAKAGKKSRVSPSKSR